MQTSDQGGGITEARKARLGLLLAGGLLAIAGLALLVVWLTGGAEPTTTSISGVEAETTSEETSTTAPGSTSTTPAASSTLAPSTATSGPTEEEATTSSAPDADDEGPSEPIASLAVAGDTGTGEEEAYATARAIDRIEDGREYDALLLLGDVIYDDGNPDEAQEKVFDPFAPVLDNGTELLAVLGNHDVERGQGDEVADVLGMPGRWYATEVNGVLIIGLDSNDPYDSDQLAWLDSTLETATQEWVIAIFHHPVLSAGDHGSDFEVNDTFVPLFDEHGVVDLVLNGHDHDYQRNEPLNGVTYIVSGAGAKLRDAGFEDFTIVSESIYSYVDLVVYPDRIDARAIDHDGNVFDSFSLTASG